MNKMQNSAKIALMLVTWLFWKVRQAFTRFSNQEPQTICVLYLSGMGDILCDTFFFVSLRKRFPSAKLSACFPTAFCQLQQNYFAFDHYIPHRSYLQTLRQLWKLNPDLIIIPGWLLKNSILAIFSNAKAILGYVNDLSFSNHLLNSFYLEAAGIRAARYHQNMKSCHLSQRPAAICAALGIDQLHLEDLEIDRHKAAGNYAVFHAGARFEGRRWPQERFAKIAGWLLECNHVDQVYLIGDNDDKQINMKIKGYNCHPDIIDKAGELNLQASYELIASAKVFIGNDSGPMHIAALAGVPTLGLLGPNFPHISGPLGKQSRVLFHKFPCSGCDQRSCDYAYRCITAISEEEVMQTLSEMLVLS